MKKYLFNKSQDEILTQFGSHESIESIKKRLKMGSSHLIRSRMEALGIVPKNGKMSWDDTEIEFLHKNCKSLSVKDIARNLKRSTQSVDKKLDELGLSLYPYVYGEGVSYKDLTGGKFNKLTVIRYSHTHLNGKTKLAYWLCKCECGNDHTVRGADLLNLKANSCGCVKKNRRKEDCYNWSGYGEIYGEFWNKILWGAKTRDLAVTITIKEAWDLFIKQERKCALSGVTLSFKQHNADLEQQTASLDRIDSNNGYISGNIQWVHKDINKMKLDMDNGKLLEWCKIIANYQATSPSNSATSV